MTDSKKTPVVRSHKKKKQGRSRSPVKCKQCSCTFVYRAALETHVSVKHGRLDDETLKAIPDFPAVAGKLVEELARLRAENAVLRSSMSRVAKLVAPTASDNGEGK